MPLSPDTKNHYGVIIIGGGLSGLAMNIQLKRKLGFTDVICYEGDSDVGGTWHANTYPGAGVDVPATFYSFSFAPAIFSSQWIQQAEILNYIHDVKKRFQVNNVVFDTNVLWAKWSPSTGLWTVKIQNKLTGEETTKTCNVVISAVGGLREPNIPEFVQNTEFKGDVFHSARWNHNVEIAGRDVVVVGNGCSASQIIPEIMLKVQHLTQVARSRQTILPRPKVPDGKLFWFLARWVPLFLKIQRFLIFLGSEAMFPVSHITKGVQLRKKHLKALTNYMHAFAPKKYWSALTPDFDVSAKRRIFEDPKRGYLAAMNNPNFELVQDDTVISLSPHAVVTASGREIKADVVVLSTGFLIQDFTYPLEIFNGDGESLLERYRSSGVRAYRGTFVSGFPNFANLMGPNTATGHSSVLFTSECQITMILKVLGPVLKTLTHLAPSKNPAPYVEVTLEAEKEYYASMRAAMKERVWEKNGGVSWYVETSSGLCTTLYPWSQINFWWNATWPVYSHFRRVGC